VRAHCVQLSVDADVMFLDYLS